MTKPKNSLLLLDEADGAKKLLEGFVESVREIPTEELAADIYQEIPIVMRDTARQAGTKKERLPKINNWICKQLMRNPKAKCPSLWLSAPEWITDRIGERAFAVRVTKCRKKNACK